MLAFIGCGTMGTALLEGIVSNKLEKPEDVILFDKDPFKTQALNQKLGVNIADELHSLCSKAKVIFLCVKPQDMKKLLLHIKPFIHSEHLLISVAAGLSISFFEEHLNNPLKIIRIMPNTPCIVGEGMSVISKGKNVSPDEENYVVTLIESLGKVVSVEENLLSAVTGLSGSGPAYVFMVIEALADGGVEMGLTREMSFLLSAQTVLGAAKMFLETGEHPALMKNKVTSPGGTTSAGLLALEEGAVRASLIKAVMESAKKAQEMEKLNQ
ncbi:MAG: pyrroline-5-carboxylate reductase [Bacillota bacterium]|nr:pyrroline-5-carboxylate reductase [Bacillota bacterium]